MLVQAVVGVGMTKTKIIWTIVSVAAAVLVAVMALLHAYRLRQSITIQGAVIESNADTRKELPLADAVITASDGIQTATTRSEASGYFKLVLRKTPLSGKPIMLSLRHPNYLPLDMDFQTGRLRIRNVLTVARMVPVPPEVVAGPRHPESVVSNIRVRYTINSRRETNIASAAKTFQVVNKANVPCNGQDPCSPDGKWKASSASASLDAGADNVFHNLRASCIAGPCPFTRIDSEEAVDGRRNVRISAVDWSETATFLVEAEVFRTEISSNVRESYPVIFGRGVNFTLPPTAEGVTLEGEIDGSPMVFPLSPDLDMSWAACTVRNVMEREKIAVYRCELKPGYRF
jgi:hypothetical protein